MARRDVDIIIKARDDASRKFDKSGRSARKFQKDIKAVSSGLLIAGAAAGSAFVAFDRLATIGDDIGKGAKKIGVTAEEFQKLSFAAERSGATAGNVNAAFKRMSSTIFDAGRGIKESTDALDELGISLDELKGLSPEEQFSIIAERLNAVEDATTKAALAQDVFGRAGTELIPMIANYKELANEAERVGLITDENVKAAERYKDQMTDLKTAATAFVSNSGLLQYLTDVVDRMHEWARLTTGEKLRMFFPGGISPEGIPAPTAEEREIQEFEANQRRRLKREADDARIIAEANKAASKAFFARMTKEDKDARAKFANAIPDFDRDAVRNQDARDKAERGFIASMNAMTQEMEEAKESFLTIDEINQRREPTVTATASRFRSFRESSTTPTENENLRANKTTAENTDKIVTAIGNLATAIASGAAGSDLDVQFNNF
jgi:hypothetical protein